MTTYAEKQEARRTRLENASERARAKSTAYYRKADMSEDATRIPFGQPILVGHHSEGKHRAALKRADNAMRASIEADKRAKDLAHKAASVGSAGISSDDETAPDQLAAKVAQLSDLQSRMVAMNTAWRAYQKNPEAAAFLALSLMDQERVKNFKAEYSWQKGPFESFQLTNNNAKLKNAKVRLAQLTKARQAETRETTFSTGLRAVENVEDNRVQLFFPEKPTEDMRKLLKSRGFRWAPSVGAWQRQISNSARYAASEVATAYKQAAQ